jgi:hypothetical protein
MSYEPISGDTLPNPPAFLAFPSSIDDASTVLDEAYPKGKWTESLLTAQEAKLRAK